MALLTKEQIIESEDRPTVELEIPEWGGSVLIRTISAAQRDKFETSLMGKDGKPSRERLNGATARFAVLVLVKADGEPMYSEGEAAKLANKSAKALTRIWEKGREFNKMGDDAIESAEENSEAAQSGNSGSD